VDRQVSHDAIVACDPVMCATLHEHGFPAGRLEQINPSSPYPVHARVVVETPVIRQQFGSSLATNVAPESLVTFGSGPRQIAVRIIAPAGAAAYGTLLAKDLQSRRAAARNLLGSGLVTASPAAKEQILAGQVDMRLLVLLFALAGLKQQLGIVAFGAPAAGESPDLPLRSVDLSLGPPGSRATYIRSLQTVVNKQSAPWRSSSDRQIRIHGQPVLQVTFAAPSPLGLLPGGRP